MQPRPIELMVSTHLDHKRVVQLSKCQKNTKLSKRKKDPAVINLHDQLLHRRPSRRPVAKMRNCEFEEQLNAEKTSILPPASLIFLGHFLRLGRD